MSEKNAVVKTKKCKCGADVVKLAKSCPECGARFKMGLGKGLLIWVIGVGVLVIIGWIGSALGGKDNISAVSTAPVVAESPTSSPTPVVEKTPEQIANAKADADAQAQQAAVLAQAQALATGNPIGALSASDVKAIIKSGASAEWGTDYQMVQFEITQETEAYNALKGLKLTQVQHDTLVKAIDKWQNDFLMVKFEYDRQMKAYNGL